jgi:hypothetical protein
MGIPMGDPTSDRQRTRRDLHELAKLAKPVAGGPGPGFDSADSSGYVDLSAFSASDSGWVDRELARAKKGAPPPPPSSRARAIDALQPESMGPVALEAFRDPERTASVRPSRARRVLWTVLGLAAVAGVAALSLTLAKHAPRAGATSTAAAAAPPSLTVAPQPAAQPPVPAPTTTPVATSVTASAASPTVSPAAPSTAHTLRRRPAASHPAVAAAAPPPVATPAVAARPVAAPPAKPAGGNDALLDLIKKSVATGK